MIHIAHMDMPLSRTGSAITNVIRSLVKCHKGPSTVITSHNRGVEVLGSNNIRVNFMGIVPRGYFDRTELFVDHAFGVIGRERPFTGRTPVPAMDALSALSPDVIILHEGYFACSAIPAWRRRFPNCGLFLYLHSHISRAYTKRELQRLLSPLDGIICVSDYMQEHVRARLDKVPNHLVIKTVLNGVDTDRFHPPEETPEETQVLFVGQVAPHKGVDVAVKSATATHAPIHLKVVGSSVHGPTNELSKYEMGLRRLAKQAEQRGSTVSFQPFTSHDELPEVYRKAGIMLVPSRFNEPFGLVCLEAMASGTAVIASNRGGLPSLCGSSAYSVELKVKAFVDKLDCLVSNPYKYQEARRKARERALTLTWMNQYNEVMAIIAPSSKSL